MFKLLELDYQIEGIETVAKQILNHVSSKTILFYGEMGAGKTTLIKSLVKLLGSDDDVSSPTFSIVNDYESKDDSIHHFDLYRISDEEEALNFGFEDYLNTSHWVFIEWPQNVQNLIPEDANIIEISYKNKTERILKLSQNHNINPQNQQKVAKF
ncbi:tRNA (adenosine(37)-N6)-threonylcarbamoyltransferase complex ATPase subunit type 1 TsaE [Psychroserpens luteus]|uniref:tRNA threonylcarbamoyladenosine biosynthesis protein TsaE n=1 Tax=Psychroserpens luteus TaxID=1434066 RepID=A0ABW5ZM03_9FLAO|nr:tRNA (adenosine(37)-N6)-threonylcarbamoyltransferase complex ATPase subunit type 1 TsaE [Psychroserpens luteus]|tara:strand:- start:49 stop:513 length:465 start_codon:yes stop_codon:yes gene_type:complete